MGVRFDPDFAFIKVHKNIKNYRQESKLSTWIASIAWKTSIDYVRKKSRSKIDFTDEPEALEGNTLVNPYYDLQQMDFKSIIKDVMVKLPKQYQVVLSLFYLEEFSLSEINEITEMPIGTIKSYLSRARNVFKKELEKLHGSGAVNLLYNEKL